MRNWIGMNARTTERGWSRAAASCVLAACLSGAACSAQVAGYGDKATGENSGDQLPQVLQKVGVTQRLNQQSTLR